MNRIIVLIIACLLLQSFSFARSESATQRDLKQTDSLSKTIRYRTNIYQLTKDLTTSYPADIEKLRAIFICSMPSGQQVMHLK